MKLDPKQQAQILTAPVRRIMDALAAAGGEARIVGGAVRDVVMGRKAGDIDLAANLPPERVMEILNAQHIKTVPTGLAHGTITAVVDHVGYEITSLRRDVATDGRHAIVEYTDDWQQDAARRDFTFNALYADATGEIYDYFKGAEDAKAGHVRFIGDAATRIREDVLRILRFFRFYAWFGKGDIDPAGLAACKELANLIPTLSAERIAREIIKLLAAPNPLPAWQSMLDNGIAAPCIGEATDIARLQILLANEKKYGDAPNALARFAALLIGGEKTADAVALRLKLANRDAQQLAVLGVLPDILRGHLDAALLRPILYRYGAENTRAALLILGGDIAQALVTTRTWENPTFPIKGEDIVKSGIPAGPQIGDILRKVESWWIAGDFRATRDACLTHAARFGKNH